MTAPALKMHCEPASALSTGTKVKSFLSVFSLGERIEIFFKSKHFCHFAIYSINYIIQVGMNSINGNIIFNSPDHRFFDIVFPSRRGRHLDILLRAGKADPRRARRCRSG